MKLTLIALAFAALSLGSIAQANSNSDCRVFNGYKLVARPGSKTPDKVAVYTCPHVTGCQMACCK